LIFYILVFFSISFFYGVGRLEKTPLRYFLLLVAFLGLWLLAGLRGDVGQDTFNYAGHFYGLGNELTYSHYFSNIEPLFSILMAVSVSIFDNVTAFYLIFSLLQAVLLWWILKRVWHYNLFLLAYLFIFYLDFHMNVLRSGMSILLFLLALSYAPSKLSFFLFLMSLSMHISTFILAPFYINRMSLKFGYKIALWVLVIFGFVAITLVLSNAISSKIMAYLINESFDFRIPKVMALIGLFGATLIFCQKKVSKEFLIVYFALLLIWVLSTGLIIFTRLNMIFILLLFFIAFENPSASIRKLYFRPTFLYALTLVLWFGIGDILSLPHEKEKRLLTGEGHPEFTFSPYSLFFESKFR